MLGSGEILVILFLILILFGGKKLPEFAQSLGKGIREFKKACYGEEETIIKTNHKDHVEPRVEEPFVKVREVEHTENK
jgi:sec-independent protein translocase protein TatA